MKDKSKLTTKDIARICSEFTPGFGNSAIIAEGKSKVIYQTPDESTYFMKFKPHVRSITSQREENVPKTEYWRILATSEILTRLRQDDIRTNVKYDHVINIAGENYLAVGKVQPIGLELIPRYVARGSLVRNFPDRYKRGDDLPCQFQKISYKIDTKKHVADTQGIDDPDIFDSYIIGMGILSQKKLKKAHKIIFQIGELVKGYLSEGKMKLWDMKFELGFDEKRRLTLIDEISQDCICATDKITGENVTKDIVRFQGSHDAIVSGYEVFARRLNQNIESRIRYFSQE